MKICLFLLLALLPAPRDAAAQKALESTFELGAPVAAGSRVTYLDLVRLVFPDADDGSPALTKRSIPLRHAEGDYQDRIFKGDMSVDYVERVFIRSGGERLAVLLIHVSPVPVLRPSPETPLTGGGVEKVAPANPEPAPATPREEDAGHLFTWGSISVLAAFRLTPAPRLLDAFDVRGDRETHLWEKHPVTALGARDSGVWFVNAHHNAGEEFRSYALAGYGAGGLRLILARAPLLHSWRGCRRGVTLDAGVETVGRRGSSRRDVAFVVRETLERFAADCRRRVRPARRRTSRHLFRWDARRARYEARD